MDLDRTLANTLSSDYQTYRDQAELSEHNGVLYTAWRCEQIAAQQAARLAEILEDAGETFYAQHWREQAQCAETAEQRLRELAGGGPPRSAAVHPGETHDA